MKFDFFFVCCWILFTWRQLSYFYMWFLLSLVVLPVNFLFFLLFHILKLFYYWVINFKHEINKFLKVYDMSFNRIKEFVFEIWGSWTYTHSQWPRFTKHIMHGLTWFHPDKKNLWYIYIDFLIYDPPDVKYQTNQFSNLKINLIKSLLNNYGP